MTEDNIRENMLRLERRISALESARPTADEIRQMEIMLHIACTESPFDEMDDASPPRSLVTLVECAINGWNEAHYDAVGYAKGYRKTQLEAELRAEIERLEAALAKAAP